MAHPPLGSAAGQRSGSRRRRASACLARPLRLYQCLGLPLTSPLLTLGWSRIRRPLVCATVYGVSRLVLICLKESESERKMRSRLETGPRMSDTGGPLSRRLTLRPDYSMSLPRSRPGRTLLPRSPTQPDSQPTKRNHRSTSQDEQRSLSGVVKRFFAGSHKSSTGTVVEDVDDAYCLAPMVAADSLSCMPLPSRCVSESRMQEFTEPMDSSDAGPLDGQSLNGSDVSSIDVSLDGGVCSTGMEPLSRELQRLQLDLAVVSQLYAIHKQRSIETRRSAYRCAYKLNAQKVSRIGTPVEYDALLSSIRRQHEVVWHS
ncbi:unnamed protein product [Protopolystoma xenopodis]|uniref:Uncharacterized protein n=1 Tax=Protopolystoma xenopodis TaxID=117903 RepID=A0A3S5BYH7_9PLAT|nr:unnamed protein product [Protopolystoma xenopodis]